MKKILIKSAKHTLPLALVLGAFVLAVGLFNFTPPAAKAATLLTNPEPVAELSPTLSIIKSVNKSLANPSDILSYTVTVSNSGKGDAINVVLTDTLPAGLTFANDDGSNSGDTEKTWNLGDLEASGDITVKYNVLVDSNAGADIYDNVAVATADNFNAVSAKASTEVKIPVILGETAPSLAITKTANKEFTNPGGTVTYTVIVTNNGDAPAMNTVLTDVLPPGFAYAGTTGQTTATWDLGDIVPTESITTKYDAVVLADTLPGNYINTATVTADETPTVSDTAGIDVKKVAVLGAETDETAELPVTGMGLMGYLYLIAAGLIITVSIFLLRLTHSKKQS